jgi:hypothetical protein
MADTMNQRVLKLAARAAGGTRRLREKLQVSAAQLAEWLAGRADPPQRVFLRAVEIILDDLDSKGR